MSTSNFSRSQACIIFLKNMEHHDLQFGNYVIKEVSFFRIEGPIIFTSSVYSKHPRIFNNLGDLFCQLFKNSVIRTFQASLLDSQCRVHRFFQHSHTSSIIERTKSKTSFSSPPRPWFFLFLFCFFTGHPYRRQVAATSRLVLTR